MGAIHAKTEDETDEQNFTYKLSSSSGLGDVVTPFQETRGAAPMDSLDVAHSLDSGFA